MTTNILAGIELGGTKCICTLGTGPGDVRDQQTVPTTTPDETLDAIAAILARWWADTPFAALGIASFGPVDLNRASPTWGYIVNTSKPNWSMTDVARRLSAPYDVPVVFDTDVNGAAAAEMAWGAGQGLSDFAYITVGTGVGVGLIVNGRPTRGFGHCELGHLRVPRVDTGPSGCPFHDDCVEGLASGPGIHAALDGRPVAEAGPGDPIWDRVASAVATLCHAIIVTAAPPRIALGGGVITRQPHLLPRIEPMLRASLNGYLALPDAPLIVAPSLGEQAGPLGPIALARAAAAA